MTTVTVQAVEADDLKVVAVDSPKSGPAIETGSPDKLEPTGVMTEVDPGSPKTVNTATSMKSTQSLSGIGAITTRQWAKYAWCRTREHMISVGMISGYLLVFYVGMMRKLPNGSVFLGLVCVCLGITLFMEGFMSGIMPLAEVLGKGIPDKFSMQSAMLTTFLLGIACTLAEPAMGALEFAGSMVKVDKAPILWYMLSKWNFYVFISVGLGVGFAALVGTLRLLRGWNLKLLIYISVFLTVGLTVVADYAGLKEVVGLAWDAGAVTTGAVTVPIILGLGIGIMMTDRANKGDTSEANPLDSFGIVTLASLFPVVGVLCLGFLCDATVTVEEIKAHALVLEIRKATDAAVTSFWDESPLLEFVYASRAVLPLILLVVALIKIKLKVTLPSVTLNIQDVKFAQVGEEDESDKNLPPAAGHVKLHTFVGISQAYLGLIVFNVGLRHGQAPLGDQVGAATPGLYSQNAQVEDSPVFESRGAGIFFVCLFTFFMAFTATYAEPALNAMGMTTEQLTHGTFKKKLLLFAVALGVGFGVMVGVLRMIFDWSLTVLLCIFYPIALALTVTSEIEYVSVGWDCAGVTTSSITVPLVLAMGIGVGTELGVQDSFGLLAMGSVGPIISVLVAGRCAKLYRRFGSPQVEPAAATASASAPAIGIGPDPGVVATVSAEEPSPAA